MAEEKKLQKRKDKKLLPVKDPYDMEEKKKLHPQADEKNFIDDRGLLVCGARKKKGPGFCRSIAGAGTNHLGYGRCKFCGGCSTGPKTQEGREKAAKNSTIHNLYASVLPEKERQIFDRLAQENKAANLENEIYIQKAKILGYLEKWNKRYEHWVEVYGAINERRKERGAPLMSENEIIERAERRIRVYSRHSDGTRQFYTAGSIEDNPLNRALETLGRLIEKHARLTQDNGDSLLTQVNAELKAASHGQVNISWGGKAQERAEKPKD